MGKEILSNIRDRIAYANAYPPQPTPEQKQALLEKRKLDIDFLAKSTTIAYFAPLIGVLHSADTQVSEYRKRSQQKGIQSTGELVFQSKEREKAETLLESDSTFFQKANLANTRLDLKSVNSSDFPTTYFGDFVDNIYREPRAGIALVELIRETRRVPSARAAKLIRQVLTYFSLKGKDRSDYMIRESNLVTGGGLYKYRKILDAMEELGNNPYTVHALGTVQQLFQSEVDQDIIRQKSNHDFQVRKSEKKNAEARQKRMQRKSDGTNRKKSGFQTIYDALETVSITPTNSKEYDKALKLVKRTYQDARKLQISDFQPQIPTLMQEMNKKIENASKEADRRLSDLNDAQNLLLESEKVEQEANKDLQDQVNEANRRRQVVSHFTLALETIMEKISTYAIDIRTDRTGETREATLKRLEEQKKTLTQSARDLKDQVAIASNIKHKNALHKQTSYSEALELTVGVTNRRKELSPLTANQTIGVVVVATIFALAHMMSNIDKGHSVRAQETRPTPSVTELVKYPVSTPVPDIKSDYTKALEKLDVKLQGEYKELQANVQWTDVGGYSAVTPLDGPTISAEQGEKILKDYNPKLVGKGIGKAFYDAASLHPVDNAVGYAFAQMEGGMGSNQEDTEITHNIFNIRWRPKTKLDDQRDKNYARVIDWEKFETKDNGSFKLYKSYEDAVYDWFRLLAEDYIKDGRTILDTPNGIVYKYAPPVDSNGDGLLDNNTEHYIEVVKDLTMKFRYEYGAYSQEDFSNIYAKGNVFGDGAKVMITQGHYGDYTHDNIDWLGRKLGGVDFIKLDENGNNISEGAPIYAVASGVVYFTWDNPKDGTAVESDKNHGLGHVITTVGYDKETKDVLVNIYTHAQRMHPDLHNGQWVNQGWIIGYAGDTGFSSAPHVHVGTYINGESKDPSKAPFDVP